MADVKDAQEGDDLQGDDLDVFVEEPEPEEPETKEQEPEEELVDEQTEPEEPEPPSVLDYATPKGKPNEEAQHKIIDDLSNVADKAEKRKKSIAKLALNQLSKQAGPAIDYIKSAGKPKKEDDSEESGQSSAKLLIGTLIGTAILVGAGAALLAGAGPLVSILAEEFIANKEWMSESSAERYQEDTEGLLLSILVFLKNQDPEDLKMLLENYNENR